MALVLVLGGTRSGKSAVAEALAAEAGGPVLYLATATPADPEMQARIAAHRARRPPEWETVAGPDLCGALAQAGSRTVLLDGLGAWIAGRMHAAGAFDPDPAAAAGGVRAEVEALVAELVRRSAPTVVVAEEAGLGPTPAGAATRAYLDLAGDAAQRLAAAAGRVLLVVAGRALELPATPAAPPPEPALRRHGDTMVPPGAADFAVNVVEDGPPAWLRTELRGALREARAYPDERAARAALAERHGREPSEVVATNGAAEAFWLLAGALRPRHAVCVGPMFTEPEAALRARGHPVTRALRGPGFALDPDAVPAGADLVVLGNPNNPTGGLDAAATIARLARPGRVLVVDEAFMDLVPGEEQSLAGRRLPGLVVLRSLTKSCAIPGLRAGYLLAEPELADLVRAHRPPWNVNTLALAALRAWAARPAAARELAERVARRRRDLAARLAGLPAVHAWPAAANFVLVRVPDGARVCARLLERGIAVRPGGTFPGLDDDHLRLTVRGPRANARLAAALAGAL